MLIVPVQFNAFVFYFYAGCDKIDARKTSVLIESEVFQLTSMELIGLGLLLVGLLLAGIEMTMPGFGIAGVTAVVSLSAGVITRSSAR